MRRIFLSVVGILPFFVFEQNTAKRKLKPSDVYRLQSIGDPQISPECNWIAYTLTTIDSVLNKRNTDHWMVSWDGKQSVQLTNTSGPYDEAAAVFSPYGKQIAFVSNHTEDPDRNINSDIFVMDAQPNAIAKKLTNWKGTDNNPVWSSNSKMLAYASSTSERYTAYEEYYLTLINLVSGEPKILSKNLDRPISNFKFSKDGTCIAVLVADDRESFLEQFNIKSGVLTKIVGGKKSFSALQAQSANNWLVIMSEPQLPNKIYAMENGNTRRLTKHQEDFVAPLELATTEGFTSKAKDGNIVSSILLRPSNIPASQKLPTSFYIHGGPTAQDEYGIDLTRQMLAAAGYAVVGVNYRGSSGCGWEYSKTISADWGNKEVKDITSAVDFIIEKGIANPVSWKFVDGVMEEL
ncbi:MAG: prolyl oligopeptidase family serine peptidase [Chitinophagaceae bacterium]|nr:prolyl oligopeptidase family serine peptidase [Chitinophagaceae bacterium]